MTPVERQYGFLSFSVQMIRTGVSWSVDQVPSSGGIAADAAGTSHHMPRTILPIAPSVGAISGGP